ncbi:MAG TPA: PDDEXK nuclease domain-containing protein [Candidatus Rifleibacterium sp.]|nr:PDDEXK nuclease domain-containing protein [Candidatus Rifleibacterium sp.]HPT45346.1 PDDEXK nuclease domain-containing protein [Candidatus Rifleibacterium sp.]
MKAKSELSSATEYKNWLLELKQKFRQAQLKAAVRVNSALLEFYWELGASIVEQQKNATWGSGFLKQLSIDLMTEFPDVEGFSQRNLEQVRRWYLFYYERIAITKQPASQLKISEKSPKGQSLLSQLEDTGLKQIIVELFQIPWWHNIVIVQKCQCLEKALFYVHKTISNGWSRAVLTHQIESGLYERSGKAITNFARTLPETQSELAHELIKDPYVFDFLTFTEDYHEKELEKALIDHIAHFLVELGAGFAYMGRQVPIQVGKKDFYIDLLFYHVKMHCYVVVELKTVDFEPEFAGKLNFYLKAVDMQIKSDRDEPTIGILLCKGKDRVVVEYALSDISKPMGVSEYQLTQSLPDELKSSLPSIEAIEAELMKKDENEK